MSKTSQMLASGASMDDCVAQALSEVHGLTANEFVDWMRSILDEAPAARAKELNQRLQSEETYATACKAVGQARRDNPPVTRSVADNTHTVILIPSCHLSDATVQTMLDHSDEGPDQDTPEWVPLFERFLHKRGWWLLPTDLLIGAPNDLLEVQALLRRTKAHAAFITCFAQYDEDNRHVRLAELPVLSVDRG